MYKAVITQEEVNELSLKAFEGSVIVVEDKQEATRAINFLKKEFVLGFDTETKPSFKKGRSNKVSLLQLAATDRVFLFRLNKIGLSKGLIDILSNDNVLKVGVAIKDDVRQLKELKQFQPAGFMELQDYVKDFEIKEKSLKKLAAIVLGFRISKSQRLSNWENSILTEPQQKYAATDAWVSLEIFKKLEVGN